MFTVFLSGCSGEQVKSDNTWGALGDQKIPSLIPTTKIFPPPTPIITQTSNTLPLTEPLDLKFVTEDGQELDGRFYPPSACPAALMIVYFPWENGDLNDWKTISQYLPKKIPYGVFSFTPRGCQGGCENWDRSGWLLDYKAALSAFTRLPCAMPSPVVTFGSSLGGDAAFYACSLDNNCVSALALSPGGWLGIPFEKEVETLVTQKNHAWSIFSQDDPKILRLYHPEWRKYYREIIVEGDKHGNRLFNNYTMGVVLEILRIELECATYAELSCPLPDSTP
jgi:pimeloyl-ACP methyl ester carboxylesterase